MIFLRSRGYHWEGGGVAVDLHGYSTNTIEEFSCLTYLWTVSHGRSVA